MAPAGIRVSRPGFPRPLGPPLRRNVHDLRLTLRLRRTEVLDNVCARNRLSITCAGKPQSYKVCRARHVKAPIPHGAIERHKTRKCASNALCMHRRKSQNEIISNRFRTGSTEFQRPEALRRRLKRRFSHLRAPRTAMYSNCVQNQTERKRARGALLGRAFAGSRQASKSAMASSDGERRFSFIPPPICWLAHGSAAYFGGA